MKTDYFESAELSDTGRKRSGNEDACLRIPERGVFCVADGMGGQAGGDLASEAIVTALQEVFAKAGADEDGTFSKRIAMVRKGVNQASKWIKDFSDRKMMGQMGSTVVVLVFDPLDPARAVALHAGDSRLYRYREDGLKVLTSDHSAAAALAAKLGRDQASIPARYQNELLRCVGTGESVGLEKTPVEVRGGDLFLICSDGLTKMLPDAALGEILARHARDPIGATAKALVDGANEAGGVDNTSVVLVKVGDISGLPRATDPAEEAGTFDPSDGVTPLTDDRPPAVPAAESLELPDTADAYQGKTPNTADLTPEKAPAAEAAAPGTLPSAAPEAKAGKKLPRGLVTIAVALAAAGVGAWLLASLANSSSKPAPSTGLGAAAAGAVSGAKGR